MLALLNISNFALISELKVEFERGLNLLTGETGSGKSILVDALGVLIGDRFASEMIRAGERHAFVEGLFTLGAHAQAAAILEEAGVGLHAGGEVELVIRRELSSEGRGRVFVNNRLATLSLLRSLRPLLVDIHGQGTQQTLFDPDTHLELLDAFADLTAAREEVSSRFRRWSVLDRVGTARAVLEDLAVTLRDFLDGLTFSPERLAEIENRLAEIARLKRKYGGTVEDALEHFARSRERLRQLEHTDERAEEVAKELAQARASYLEAATRVHSARLKSAEEFRRAVERSLGEVAMEHARFEARVTSPAELDSEEASKGFAPTGFDRVEFYFSANAGEPLRPLAKVASGGEASRMMLVLKTSASPARFPRTVVFGGVDAGIGGRVS